MLKAKETVVDYVIKEIKSCMTFTPIIYIETDDRRLMEQLLRRKDCFTILKADENGNFQNTEYSDSDETLNVVKISRATKWTKIRESFDNRPVYFVAADFNLNEWSTQRRIIQDYIREIYEKKMEFPLKQNLIVVSPLSMSVGDGEGNSIPSGFEQYIHVIDVPLLGIRDIAQQVVDVQNKALKQMAVGDILIEEYMKMPDSYIFEFKGMNRSQIDYVLYELQNHMGVVSVCGIPNALMNKVEVNKLNRLAKELIRKQKQQFVTQNGDIEYIDTDNTVVPGGIGGVKEWIQGKRKILENPQRAESYDIHFPKGILVAGLPGSGKSLMAKYIASQLGLTLIQFKMDMILQGIVGSSEQRMKQVLKLFEASAPCMIWIDEIEKELAGMKGSGESDSGVNKRCFAKLLNWMQENKEKCFIYATANRTAELPQELLRRGRFDRLYYSFLPMEEQCVEVMLNQIVKTQEASPKLFNASVNCKSIEEMGHRVFEKVAAYEHRFFTGADIEGVIADVKEMMFNDMSRDISDGNSSYGIEELEKYILCVVKNTISYAESHYDEVLDYWIGLRAHQYHNVAVKENDDTESKYRYMLFDFADIQYDGKEWRWRKDLKCISEYSYDKKMFMQLTESIKKRIATTK